MSQGNGDDPTTARMVDLLGQLVKITSGIRDEVTAFKDETREALIKLNGEVGALREELTAFKDETRGELIDIRGELHQIRDEVTGIHRETARLDDRFEAVRLDLQRHDGRIAALEALLKKTG